MNTGLPIPGNLYAILLVAWFVVLAAVCLLVARTLLPADREDPPLFPQASPWLPRAAHSGGDGALPAGSLRRSGPALRLLRRQRLTGSGGDGDRFVTAQGSQSLLRKGVSGGGSAVSSLGGQPASRCACLPHPAGGRARKPFQSPLLLVPVCCLVVRLVLTYRVVSVDPSLTDYYTELLAVVFLALAFYRLSSFAFRAGGPAASPSMRR